MRTIFDYECYKEYLNERIQSGPKRGRGVKKNLAEFLRCKTSLISAILSGDRDFSLDQAIQVSRFFSLGLLEKDFFIFMVGHEKAGTQELKDYYKEKLENYRKSHSHEYEISDTYALQEDY